MLNEQLGQPSFNSGPNIKLYTINWLRPSKRSASVFLPPGASKTYSLSTFTQGNCRRSALTASRCRVRFFSLASSSLRAAIHSSRDTTLGLSIVLLLVTPLLMTLSQPKPHPGVTVHQNISEATVFVLAFLNLTVPPPFHHARPPPPASAAS